MGIEEFIGETEASTLSGVSSATLKRFAEAGYLKPENDADGLKLYSKSELAKLFQIEFESNVVHFPKAETFKPMAEKQASTTQGLSAENQTLKRSEDKIFQTGNAAVKSEVAQYVAPQQPQRAPEALLFADAEIDKLKNVIKLQEDLMKYQDKRIEDLIEERGWLRNQISEFQEKASRDQVLLLSQTQALSKSLTVLRQRKGLITKALERVGLLPAPQEESSSNSHS